MTSKTQTKKKYISLGVILAVAVLMLIFNEMGMVSRHMQSMLVPICINIILAVSLNITVGFLGELTLGHAGFMSVGAYAGCLFSIATQETLPMLVRFPLAMLVGGLVAAVFGGVTIGVGLGVVFLAGASTGGADIVARLLKLKLRNFPIGKLMLCMDLAIAVATGVVYRQFTNTLYSIVTLYLSSIMLDKVVYGFDYAKVALIISDKYEEIAAAIDARLDRGVTLLQGQGFYKRNDKYVLLSAVKRKQLAQLKELVMTIDPAAFIILQDAQQVLGDGFKRYDRFEL